MNWIKKMLHKSKPTTKIEENGEFSGKTQFAGYLPHLEICEGYAKTNPRNCAVLERTADGVSVGACCYYLRDGTTCPRHGKVMVDNAKKVDTDLTYRRWLVNDSPQWVRCAVGREDGTVDMALCLAFRAGLASSSNASSEPRDKQCSAQPVCSAWPMPCPYCGDELLFAEDRGIHCDGCDDLIEEDIDRICASSNEKLSALLVLIKMSFEIATSALVQAKINLGILGFNRTKNEVASVILDLHKAIKLLEA